MKTWFIYYLNLESVQQQQSQAAADQVVLCDGKAENPRI